MNRPTLIIGCSEKKLEGINLAFELYQGGMFSLIKANLVNPLEEFNILILSAKYGLIDASDKISPYDKRMPVGRDKQAISSFASEHAKKSGKTLTRYMQGNGSLFIVLSNDYLCAFDEICKHSVFNRVFRKFPSVYVSRKHRGIGELRGRLKKILTFKGDSELNATLFRSGLASHDELVGFSVAGCDLGASLAYISDIKAPHRLQYLNQALKRNKKVFLDNGMITEIGRGKFVSSKDVFERYIAIVKSMKPALAKNLSIVVPDDPFSCINSINIAKQHKNDIKWLAKRVNVIIPIHRAENIGHHAMEIVKALDNISGLCVGIPCKEKIKTENGFYELRLSLSDVEILFNLKRKNGEPVFKKAHFLALSEVSRKRAFEDRKLLCDMYSVKMFCDACRTTAVMGNNENSRRVGSVLRRKIESNKTKKKTITSSLFLSYQNEDEYDYSYIHEKICQMIEESPSNFIAIWNSNMSLWKLCIEGLEDSEAKSYCKGIVDSLPRYLEVEVLDSFKLIFWDEFETDEDAPTAFDVRAETFTQLFLQGKQNDVQLEMVI